ncbi:MAG: DMT family transporter [Clostridia bacterium]|nr:DMT family transporter [Clostridia bacterium]
MKKIGNIIFLHSIIFLYALTSLCSKFASGMEFFSRKWILVYGLQIFILGIYAILWQQILKRMNLNFAYANKSLALVWGMLFGFLVFKETISVWNILGAVIVLIGVIVMVTGEDEKEVKNTVKENEDLQND